MVACWTVLSTTLSVTPTPCPLRSGTVWRGSPVEGQVTRGDFLFVAAGTPAWPGARAFLVEMITLELASAFWLLHHDPELLEERPKAPVQQGQSAADRWIMGAFLVLWCVWLAAMGLEVRWLGVPLAPWTETAGTLLVAISIAIVCWTCSANSYV